MLFPLKKNSVITNHSATEFLDSYQEITEIPVLPHPGAFGCVRKNHQHEGVDLYCVEGEAVYAIEAGIILDIFAFTGKHAGSPWWEDTWAILVEGENHTCNYGEIIPSEQLQKGMQIQEGEILGYVKTVLKKDKGRPRSMLHLEMYEKGTKKAITEWSLNTPQPVQLLDPTPVLLEIIHDRTYLPKLSF